MTRFRELAAVTVVLTLTASAWWVPRAPAAQSFDATALGGAMRWRPIGPFRGGRTKAITGVPGDLHTFYMAPVNGGVWKTTDLGRTWTPIFDDQPTGSIGSIAVAPSDPNVIYVGSGEGLARPDLSVGDGIYKSTDAGQHAGRISAFATASRFRTSSSTRETPIGCSSRCSATRTDRTRSAACIGRPTAAPPSRRSCRRTRTPARPISNSIRRIPTSSTPACGSSGRDRGKTARGPGRPAASSSRSTAARRGDS